MARSHKRHKGGGTLNLTALMDIFTILVFFLMVNQNEVKVDDNDQIELPASIAENKPGENLVVMVNRDGILVQGIPVETMADIKGYKDEETLPNLLRELEYMANRTPMPQGIDENGETVDQGRPINIVGDKDTPYELLKRVMNTCAKATFSNISLAVNQIVEGGGQ
ncbi:MAG: RNA polymerase subunit sigma-70 [Oceanospirillaceae bacterium]|nr:RNA polymerase subunit sigma-70 [Oceanospirillaceae bacterium]